MTREPNFERLVTALRCGQPDYVPLVELGIAKSIKEVYMGRPVNTLKDEIDFAVAAGYDYVKLQPIIDMNPGKIKGEGAPRITKTSAGVDRVWAAEHNTSVSRILGALLKRMKKEKTGYAQAMQQFLSVKPQPLKKSGAYPSRDELHER